MIDNHAQPKCNFGFCGTVDGFYIRFYGIAAVHAPVRQNEIRIILFLCARGISYFTRGKTGYNDIVKCFISYDSLMCLTCSRNAPPIVLDNSFLSRQINTCWRWHQSREIRQFRGYGTRKVSVKKKKEFECDFRYKVFASNYWVCDDNYCLDKSYAEIDVAKARRKLIQ